RRATSRIRTGLSWSNPRGRHHRRRLTNASEKLRPLQPFQWAIVDHMMNHLWKDPDAVDKFFVADEVGLGKTMVAKGVIARTGAHLRGIEDRIDFVYITSNAQIARQNLSRLNVVDGYELSHADRLTLLPIAMRDLTSNAVTSPPSLRAPHSTYRTPGAHSKNVPCCIGCCASHGARAG